MTNFLIQSYALLLNLYPRHFYNDYGREMQLVFMDIISGEKGFAAATIFFKELLDLPKSILSIYRSQRQRGQQTLSPKNNIAPSTHRQALVGTLPFLVYGIVYLIDNLDLYSSTFNTNIYLVFYGLVLTGLMIGWIRGFPIWSYSYLGWSLVFAWWWTDISIFGINWSYNVWIPFGAIVLLALFWTRSLAPIKKLLWDIWNDWTRLSLAMFTLGAWIFIGGGENHHPLWILFNIAASLTVSAGAWFFLRSSNLFGRIMSIAVSFISSAILTGISYLTWNWRTHYGLPPAESWRDELGVAPIGVLFWLLILFWPALIALIHFITPRRNSNQ